MWQIPEMLAPHVIEERILRARILLEKRAKLEAELRGVQLELGAIRAGAPENLAARL